MQEKKPSEGLYVLMLSIHGLIRGEDPELGRDPDTGGQIKYVLELARALSAHPEVSRVDLLTRQVVGKNIDPIYAQRIEPIAPKANIVRLPCGPRRYLRKERLWPYLDSFADQALMHIRSVGRIPDVIHGHYADAGYVGSSLVSLLGVPLIFTGHSLGRVKKARLMEKGETQESLERKYNITRRIEGEEAALESAALVIGSTRQEVEEQYSSYDNYVSEHVEVLPPGVPLNRFSPPEPGKTDPPIRQKIDRFLEDPEKPLILAMSRPDYRKNLHGLVKAYATNQELLKVANLAIVAGNRDDLRTMPKGQREVLNLLLYLIDFYDLYGRVAYPKHHDPETDVPDLYRLAAARHGVFVNTAFTEPFGLTLIEAAASGVPVVATHDGGPENIVETCRHGILVNPSEPQEIGDALLKILQDRELWERLSQNGSRGAHKHYSWKSHTEQYIEEINNLIGGKRPGQHLVRRRRSRLPMIDRILVVQWDILMNGDPEALQVFLKRLREAGDNVAFAISTGRGRNNALATLKEWGVPQPNILLACVGTEIYYGPRAVLDRVWDRQVGYQWRPQQVRAAMEALPGIAAQKETEQHKYKLSYNIADPKKAPSMREILRHLRRAGLSVRPVLSYGKLLDVLPIRVSPGSAIRHLAFKWDVNPDKILVAGMTGADERMLRGDTLGVVVGNHGQELEKLRSYPRIYFAENHSARGLLEGIDKYDFFGNIRIPNPETDTEEREEEAEAEEDETESEALGLETPESVF